MPTHDPHHFDAVLIVSFGGPERPEEVMPFLRNVTAGTGVPQQRLEAVAEQYMRTGGSSPINEQNRELLVALRIELAASGMELPVYLGNRHWHPFLADTVAQMQAEGVRRAAAFVTSAYSSYPGCRAYLEAIERARAEAGPEAPGIEKLRQFWDHPGFIAPFRRSLARCLDELSTRERSAAHLIFTAHSLPVSMAATSQYEEQLREAMELVATEVAPELSRSLVWQSRSGSPQVPWLEPDVNDHLEELAERGATAAVVVPIGFVSDHQEVRFDLDVRAAETARRLGVKMLRVATPGTDPEFVAMIRELLLERIDPAAERRHLGQLGPRPEACAAECCPAP